MKSSTRAVPTRRFHRHHGIGLIVLAIVLGLLVIALMPRAAAAGAWQEILADGKQDFEENCVACHGQSGRGDGPMASKLVFPPKDITTIFKRNGGEFQFWRVFDIIAGEVTLPGHDALQMPAFYESLKAQNFKPGYLPAHVRILELTHYIESIQEKPPE